MPRRELLIFQGIPFAVILLPFVWFGIVGNKRMLMGEGGIVENLTVLFLLIAILVCVVALKKTKSMPQANFLRLWLVLLILGSTYFALEEISYGQHLFGWSANETWKELNDQDETNLHNIHWAFDQLPRNLLTLGILVGGVIMPLYRHFRKIELVETDRLYWQWPTMDCVTIGVMVILIRPILSVVDIDFINTGETKENLFALFILLYCVSLNCRLRQKTVDST